MSVKIVDVNVLLHAVNQDADQHGMVRRLWEKALNGTESVGLPWIVLSGFLRISTNPKVYPEPMSTDRALDKVGTWLSAHVVSVVRETPDHWPVFVNSRGLGHVWRLASPSIVVPLDGDITHDRSA